MLPEQLVTSIIANHRGQILLMLRDANPNIANPGRWALIGGHIEEDETPVGAAAREILEETGIQVLVSDLTLLTVLRSAEREKQVFYVVGRWSDADVVRGEGRAMRFFSLAQARKLPVSNEHRQALHLFLQRGRNGEMEGGAPPNAQPVIKSCG